MQIQCKKSCVSCELSQKRIKYILNRFYLWFGVEVKFIPHFPGSPSSLTTQDSCISSDSQTSWHIADRASHTDCTCLDLGWRYWRMVPHICPSCRTDLCMFSWRPPRGCKSCQARHRRRRWLGRSCRRRTHHCTCPSWNRDLCKLFGNRTKFTFSSNGWAHDRHTRLTQSSPSTSAHSLHVVGSVLAIGQ